jgi:hypothetical protein
MRFFAPQPEWLRMSLIGEADETGFVNNFLFSAAGCFDKSAAVIPGSVDRLMMASQISVKPRM